MSTYGSNGLPTQSNGPSGYGGDAPASPTYQPPRVQPAPTDTGFHGDPFNGLGAVQFDLTDPQGSVDKAVQEAGDVFTGLKSFLFGTDRPDAQGNHGGLPILGWGPIGDATRFTSEVVANVGGGIVGHTADAVGATLERIPSGRTAGLEEQFNALPADSEAKQAALKQMEADKGLFGTGLLSGREHYMSLAIQQHEEEMAAQNPNLWSGLFRPNASLADSVSNLFGVLGASQRGTERLIAGAGRPGADGQNQLQLIMAVGRGEATWTADDPGLTPVEQQVFDKVSSGEWGETEALDFMASHGAGLAHSKALEIAGSMAADPLNVATLGAGALAKFGQTGFMLSKTLTEARAGLAAAEAAGDVEKVAQFTKAIEVASAGIKSGVRGEGVASRDVLGQLAKQKWTGTVARKYGQFYGELEATTLGKAAKAARTVIDPMHAIEFKPRGAAAIDQGSQDVVHAVVSAHGEFTHIDTIRSLREMDGGSALADAYNEGLAIYSGNVFRRVAGRQYRAVQMMMKRGEELFGDSTPFKAMDSAVKGMKRRGLTQLEEEAGKFVKRIWSEEDDINLSARMSTLWGGRTAEEWLPDLAKMSGEQKSLIHAATYGSAVKQLHAAKQAVRAAGQAGTFADRLDQLVLLNRRTLTDLGAEGILKRIEESAADITRQMAIIEEARQTYPELRSFVMDPTSHGETLTNFLDMMERRRNFLPAQIRDAERPTLPEALRDFDSLITPNGDPQQAVFTIGFRPKDEFLWGLERDSDGVLREVHDPWMDQVSTDLQAYSPVREVPRNIAGMPIIGAVATQAAKGLDFAEAVGRTAMHGVTGKMVTQAAHVKFVEKVAAKYVAEDGTPLLTSQQVETIWKSLMDKVDDSENISGLRGLSEGAIWDAAKKVIPSYAEKAGLDRRALLVHVLDAYDGDLRYIGLTQKLSSKAKLALGKTFPGNTAGMVAEHAWPLLKFRLNPFFQLQEKIEPWVLSAQRGAAVALGTKMTDIDRATAAVYRNFAERNLINIADNDIAELSAKYVLGKRLGSEAAREGGRLGKALTAFEGLTDVQGTKQLAMMRTFKKGLGKTMRQAWDEAMPGEFDRMLNEQRALMGEVIDEDDFAVLHAHSNLAANDIPISMVDGKPMLDFTNAILEGQWSAPQHLGEMRALNLDYMARRLGLRDSAGEELLTSMDFRRALADGRISQQDISRELRQLGAHPDYVARVESALGFSWPEFWKSVQTTYGLSDAERLNFEGMFSRIAQRRDMTPTEYLSQVYSPHVLRGTEGAVGSLGALVQATRTGLPTPDLGILRGIEGQSTIEDFYRQAGAIMSAHLDPSAKRAFLIDMLDPHGDGSIRRAAARGEVFTDMREIEEAFNSQATDALSMRIMNFLQGTPGTGPHTLVANEATGVAAIRDLATEYRAAAGRPRNLQRFIADDAPDMERLAADALDGIPTEYEHVATADDLAKPIEMDMVRHYSGIRTPGNFKTAEFHRLPQPTRNSYEARMLETRRLFTRITKPRSEGGLGIKVRAVAAEQPYRNANAMRADLANGVIKVPKRGYWHPLIHNEDLFMERVVHDVFGHGQEANVLNSHDALFSAAAMYSDEARATFLTDNFARSAWERGSQTVVPQAVAEPTTIAEYETRWGAAADRIENMPTGALAPGHTSIRNQSRTLGTGIRALPEDVQREAITHLGSLRNQFPNVGLDAFDIGVIPAAGMTLEYELEHPTIVLNLGSGWQADPAIRNAHRQERLAVADATAMNTKVRNEAGQMVPRKSLPGAPMFASATPTGDLYHEFGHAVDIMLHKRVRGARKPTSYGSRDMTEFMRSFKGSESHTMLSEYAFNKSDHEVLRDSDLFAELFDLAFNPEHDIEDLYGTPLMDDVMEFRSILKDEGVWVPDGTPVAANPHAGKTVAEANAAGAGIRAPFKMGTLPQDTLDSLTGHFIGSGRYAESNPDIGRMAGYLRDHMRDTLAYTFETGTASPYAHMFDALSGIPVSDAVPFNLTEAAMWHGAAQMMAAKWEDAFRLQYFAQNRSMLQRSINHPMFGLYPASYMWGKIGPEMVRFIAREPFGMKTGALAYTLSDLQKAVAVQRQYDPEFAKAIDDIGSSAALSFLGYMLPATPWDVPASYPAWLRDAAQQGLENNARQAEGGNVRDDNFVTPLGGALKRLFPMSTQLPFAARALGDIGDALPWNQKPEEEVAPPPATHFDLPPAGNAPAPAGNAPAPAGNAPAGAQGTTGAVPATGLTAVLAPEMRSLQDILSGA